LGVRVRKGKSLRVSVKKGGCGHLGAKKRYQSVPASEGQAL